MRTAISRSLLAVMSLALLVMGGFAVPAEASQGAPVPPSDGGAVVGWGDDGEGQTDVPAGLAGKTVTAIAAGGFHSLALTSDGQVTAWGYDGSGATDVPAGLAGKTVTAIAAGTEHSLALTSDGQVTAWGQDGSGATDVPASLAGKTVTAIAAGGYHSLALTSDGQVTAWGYDDKGETDVPASLAGKTVTAIAAGFLDSFALTSDGQVTAWGDDSQGQTDVPASLTGKTVTAIAAGEWFTLALTSDGQVTAWGNDSEGQTDVPASLTGKTVTAIAAGLHAPFAVTSDGQVTAWGRSADGQTSLPSGLAARAVTALSGGVGHALAIVRTVHPDGPPVVTGTLRVGSTLTVTDGPYNATPESVSYQWLRDGLPVDGATSTTYALTNTDAGAQISCQVTSSRAGYADASVTSDTVGPVEGGVITPVPPSVTGRPQVDSPLTASVAGFDPADADAAFQWKRGGTTVGNGSTYTPNADDAGQALTVTATYTKDHFDAANASTTTDAVASAPFTVAPEAGISGTARVGQLLTASQGATSPTPDAYHYRWFADGAQIPGAVERKLLLTDAEKDQAITVEVTAVRAGYSSVSDLSDPTSAVAPRPAPSVRLSVARDTIRRGQSTTLAWCSHDATQVTASRGWVGVRALHGRVTVRPSRIGTTTYALTAVNESGTTTAQVSVDVRRQAKKLHVVAANGLRLRGRKVTLRSAGLDRGERYAIRIAGRLVATGHATRAGHVDRSVVIPTSTREGRANVSVTGSEKDRTGTDTLRVVVDKRLGLRLAQHRVRASDHQRVTITGLAAGEPVNVTYQGRRISARHAHANRHGTWTRIFDVDIYWGTKTVNATGQYAGRNATSTFTVVRRCSDGVRRCR